MTLLRTCFRLFLFLSLCLVAACESEGAPTELLVDIQVTRPDAEPIAPFLECTVTTAHEPTLSRTHVPECSPLSFATSPPTTGNHFGRWADFRTYEAPVPWGYLVHSMEHGAIVMAYNCEGDCSEVREAFQTLIDEQPLDDLCRTTDFDHRLIVVPAPDLEVPLALLSWERRYLATCVDLPSMRAFVSEYYGTGREALCAAGVDRSATDWCENFDADAGPGIIPLDAGIIPLDAETLSDASVMDDLDASSTAEADASHSDAGVGDAEMP